MEAKYYTDGIGVFKIHKTTIVLENLESAAKVETKFQDDGTIKGFRPLVLNQTEQAPKESVKIETPRKITKPRKLSRFWGVSAVYGGKFKVEAYINGVIKYGGTYPDEDEAARKADELLAAAGLPARNFPGLPIKSAADKTVYSCIGCGETYEVKPDKCPKCNGTSFETSTKAN